MPIGAGGVPGRLRPGTSFGMRYSLDLRRVAARQHGLVTLEQAVAAGWSRATWYRACADGRLGLVAPAVAALPGAPDTSEQRILAAILARGGRAIASHRSAAYLWGVDIEGAKPVDITGPDRGCRTSLGWVAAHNPRDVDDLRPVQRRGVPTTNPLRVLVDLGQVAPGAVVVALEHFLAEGLVDLRAVRAATVRHGRQGRHGISALRTALDSATIDDVPADSELEQAMARLLSTHDLPPARFHARILGFEVDFAIVPERVVLECDGWTSHGLDRAQFERDRRRDAALVAGGWVVLRFTWTQIIRRPTWVADAIRRTLVKRAPAA
jgi:very-short-patch-repair endonuclease